MNRKTWMEKTYGRRPSSMTRAMLQDKVRALEGLLAVARKIQRETEIWDVRFETARQLTEVR